MGSQERPASIETIGVSPHYQVHRPVLHPHHNHRHRDPSPETNGYTPSMLKVDLPTRCPVSHQTHLPTDYSRANGKSPTPLQNNVLHIQPTSPAKHGASGHQLIVTHSPKSRPMNSSLQAVEGMVQAVPADSSVGGGSPPQVRGHGNLPMRPRGMSDPLPAAHLTHPRGDQPPPARGPGPPTSNPGKELSPRSVLPDSSGLPPVSAPTSSGLPSTFQPPPRPVSERHLQLEFDGDTVLCRVCGDKASGFHYGVHACEGCKGFFRRSIQQKIQYRPCLKNQQCNIMRVNRNRCQYCRLKKCIAVGMSRDAVRFGRVPKKEKAKIMEQMQKVNTQSQVNLLTTILESEGDMVQKILEAHLKTCEFTRNKFRAFLESSWKNPQFVNCSAHLACPFNPHPDSAEGARISDEFSECFTPAIRNVVNFAKSIPGFLVLSQEDQVTLLKAGTFEVLLVHLACLFDSQTNTMLFMNGKLFKRVSLTVTNSAGFLLDSMFDFADRMNALQLTDEEVALFSAIVIIASDRPGLRNVEQVEKVQNRITQSLQAMMATNHSEDPALFAKLLMKIPDLRTLNTLHSEKLLGLQVSPSPGKNGGHTDKVKMSPESPMNFFQNGMMSPGMGAGLGAQQPLTPAEVAHQVAVATSQQVAMEARLQNNMMLHPSFRGYHPYTPAAAAAAAALHLKHYQAGMNPDMTRGPGGKCPYSPPGGPGGHGGERVPKTERPANGYKSEQVLPETAGKFTAESSRRSYEESPSYTSKGRERSVDLMAQQSPTSSLRMDAERNSKEPGEIGLQDRSALNGGLPDGHGSYRSQHNPYWMSSHHQGQGHERSGERSSGYGESSHLKRSSGDKEEDTNKRKVAKIWDVPLGEASIDSSGGRDGMMNGMGRDPEDGRPAVTGRGGGSLDAGLTHGIFPYPTPVLPAQHFLPYPPFPRQFPHRQPEGSSTGQGRSHVVPSSSQSDCEKSPNAQLHQEQDDVRRLSGSATSLSSKDSTGSHSSSSPVASARGTSSTNGSTGSSSSALNLPVLKSVLSSPPLSAPTSLWSTDRILGRRRHSTEDVPNGTGPTNADAINAGRSHSEDFMLGRRLEATSPGGTGGLGVTAGFVPIARAGSSLSSPGMGGEERCMGGSGGSGCTSPNGTGPYRMHKKMKMKHHRSSGSCSGSDRSNPATPSPHSPHSPPTGVINPPKQTSPLGIYGDDKNLNLSKTRSPDTINGRDPHSYTHYDNAKSAALSDSNDSQRYPNGSISSLHVHEHSTAQLKKSPTTNNTENMRSASDFESAHFNKEDRFSSLYSSSDYEKHHRVNYHNISDHVGEAGERRRRILTEGEGADNNNVKSATGDAEGPERGLYPSAGKDAPPAVGGGLAHAGFGGFPPGPGTNPHPHASPPAHHPHQPPHPAYLSPPFPPGAAAAAAMHPALLYQYNQYAAGLQLAQLQQLQMAQAAHMAHAAHAHMQAAQERSHHVNKERSVSPTRDAEIYNDVERHGRSAPTNQMPPNEVKVKQEPV